MNSGISRTKDHILLWVFREGRDHGPLNINETALLEAYIFVCIRPRNSGASTAISQINVRERWKNIREHFRLAVTKGIRCFRASKVSALPYLPSSEGSFRGLVLWSCPRNQCGWTVLQRPDAVLNNQKEFV